MIKIWINIWRDMFKLLPPHVLGREEFALSFVMIFSVFCAFISLGSQFFSDTQLLFFGNLFCIAWTSLFVRRLRDAGILSILGLVPYGWILFWWYQSFDATTDQRVGIGLIGFFGLFPIVAIIFLLCLFSTKKREIYPLKGESSTEEKEIYPLKRNVWENEFLRSGINLWKNIFRFMPPHKTGRREFAYCVIWCIILSISSFGFLLNTYLTLIFIFLVPSLGIAFLSLCARRLRDAGFSFWWLFLPIVCIIVYIALLFYPNKFELLYELVPLFGFISNISFIVIMILCLFPTKRRESYPLKRESSTEEKEIYPLKRNVWENEFLRSGINLWKNIFRFMPPHKTGRREFAYCVVWLICLLVLPFVPSIFPYSAPALSLPFLCIVLFFLYIAFLSLCARRLRDAGFSFLWLFLFIVCTIVYNASLFYPNVFKPLHELMLLFGFMFYPSFIVIMILCSLPSKN